MIIDLLHLEIPCKETGWSHKHRTLVCIGVGNTLLHTHTHPPWREWLCGDVTIFVFMRPDWKWEWQVRSRGERGLWPGELMNFSLYRNLHDHSLTQNLLHEVCLISGISGISDKNPNQDSVCSEYSWPEMFSEMCQLYVSWWVSTVNSGLNSLTVLCWTGGTSSFWFPG